MTAKRKLIIIASFLGAIFLLGAIFFVGVHIGAKQEYFRQSSFNAFNIMRDLEALRSNQTASSEITALIQEKETNLDTELITVSTYHQSGLNWLSILSAKSNDRVFLRSIANYRQRYPSQPMVTKYLTQEQRKIYLKLYSEILKEQNLLLEKYQ